MKLILRLIKLFVFEFFRGFVFGLARTLRRR